MRFAVGIRTLLGVIIAFALIFGSVGNSLAQATPESESTTSPGLLFDVNGNESAQITVNEVADPYENADAADRGFRWVGIELEVDNLGDAEFELDTYNIKLIDELGFASTAGFTPRDDDAEEAEPALTRDPIASGDSVTGWLFFQVTNDATVTQVIYADLYGDGQFALLANLGDEIPVDGAEIVVNGTDGNEIATATIDEIIPDFQEIDSEVSSARGTSIVAVNLTMTSTGDADLETNTYSLFLIDELGYAYSPGFFSRGEESEAEYPEFPFDDIAVGDTASGVLLYEVPSDATVSAIVYSPDIDLFYVLSYSGSAAMAAGDDDARSDDDDATPTKEADDTDADSADCTGAGDWAAETIDNLNDWADIIGQLDPQTLDPDQLRDDADAIRDIATAQADSEHPDAVDELNTAISEAFFDSADALDTIADGVEEGDNDLIVEGGTSISEIGTSFQSGDVADLLADTEEVCPDISDL